MPQLTQQSAQMTQAKLESAVPVVNKLLDDMTNELTRKPPPRPRSKRSRMTMQQRIEQRWRRWQPST
jgi:hypothetical protein